MAGSSVKLYYDTKIRPEKNARIEGLEAYLAGKSIQSITLNKYVKHDLSISIKIDTEELSSYVWTGDVLNPFASGRLDYVAIKNDKDTGWIYYFVMNQAWTASKTVTLELALDTINSFDGCYEFTDRTVVSREHKSRYNDENEITYKGIVYLPREFYLDGDGITPQLYKQDEWTIEDSKANYDWYLLYMANNEAAATKGDEYAVNAYLIGGENIGVPNYVNRLKITDFVDTNSYWLGSLFDNSYTVNDQIILENGSTISTEGAFAIYKDPFTDKITLYKALGMGEVKKIAEIVNYIDFSSKNKVYTASYDARTPILAGDLSKINTRLNARVTGSIEPTKTAGQGQGVDSIDTVDRTDTRIISIIKLPYAPINIDTSGEEIILPPEVEGSALVKWQNEKSYYYYKVKTDFLSGFEKDIGIDYNKFISGWMVPKNNLINAVTRGQFYESALYRSEYFQMKFVYDSFNYVIQNELLNGTTYVGKDLTQPWYMKMVTTSTMNSRFLFDFNNNNKGINYWKELQDYPYLMNIARNNNIVTYNSEYVNYMRNGYNYDVKAKNAALLQAGLGIATGVIGTGLSLASGGIGSNILAGINANKFARAGSLAATLAGNIAETTQLGARLGFDVQNHYNTINALGKTSVDAFNQAQKYAQSYNPTANILALGQMINGVTSIINGVESIAATERTFEQKQQQIKQASVSVSGSDDIDLLSYYSGNRMKLERWEASPRMQKALFDLYYYQGYATNEQKVPLHNDRKWFDFLQCQADIKNTKNLDQRYIDNLKDRFSIGVTYYHNNNGVWDIDQEKENIETWIS